MTCLHIFVRSDNNIITCKKCNQCLMIDNKRIMSEYPLPPGPCMQCNNLVSQNIKCLDNGYYILTCANCDSPCIINENFVKLDNQCLQEWLGLY